MASTFLDCVHFTEWLWTMLPGDTWSSSLVRMYLLFGVASAISETLLAFSSRGFNPCHCFRRLHTSMSVSSKSLETMTCHCMRLSSCTRGWAITRKTLLWGSRATGSMLLRLKTHKALVSTAFTQWSPNTAPATQNECPRWCASHMNCHFQCAEPIKSPCNLTK